MSDERSFEPTHRRLERAASEGDVARSAEASALAAFAAAAATLSFELVPMLAAARALLLSSLSARRIDDAAVGTLLFYVLAVPAAGAAGALAVGVGQTRLSFHLSAPAPKWERLNPAEGIKRILSRETAIHLVRWLAVSIAIAICGAQALRVAAAGRLGDDPMTDVDLARRVSGALLEPALALGAAGAVWEYVTAHRSRLRRLRMSRDEVKRELRESEGDPHRKAHRARFRRALRSGSVAAVRDATVVVVNPTHVAVALRYDPGDAPVPLVVGKGADERAAAMRLAAERYAIPIVEDTALARLLFVEVAVGSAIPEATFGAVAAIIAAIVREARHDARRREAGT